mgnify:CR=1 FL=1
MLLNNEEMLKVKGGAFKYGLLAGLIGGAIVFVVGVIDGLLNPRKCN